MHSPPPPPVMDGDTAIRAIRALPRAVLPRRPLIVAVTACAFEEDRQRCLRAGADAYLQKPTTLVALQDTVNGLMRGVGAAEQSG